MEVSTCPSAASTSLKREPTMSRKVFCAGSCTCASTNRQFAAANNLPIEEKIEGESQRGEDGEGERDGWMDGERDSAQSF